MVIIQVAEKSKTVNGEKFDIKAGDTIKVYQIIKEKSKKKKGLKTEIKERIQIFEGLVLAKKHGNEIGATITVRKIVAGIGVEKIFPIHSPKIQKIEIIKRSKVRRAKLYYIRTAKGKKARLKKIKINPLPKKVFILDEKKPEEFLNSDLTPEKDLNKASSLTKEKSIVEGKSPKIKLESTTRVDENQNKS